MGKIYVLSSSDLPNHAVIFENKEVELNEFATISTVPFISDKEVELFTLPNIERVDIYL